MRLIPPHILAASPLHVDAIVPTLYDPDEFAMLYHTDKDRALAAAMTEPQRVRQALAYCAWHVVTNLSTNPQTTFVALDETLARRAADRAAGHRPRGADAVDVGVAQQAGWVARRVVQRREESSRARQIGLHCSAKIVGHDRAAS